VSTTERPELVPAAAGLAATIAAETHGEVGDPEAILEQTRPMWSSWGMREERARTLAQAIFDPAYADGPSRCACGGEGGCQEQLISVDVLSGAVRPA